MAILTQMYILAVIVAVPILLFLLKTVRMSLWQKNRPFFLFLIKFGLSYLVLSVLYGLYLDQYNAAEFEVDGATAMVARQSEGFAVLTGQPAHIEKHPTQAAYRFFMGEKSVARVVEGCNAVSVMILFVAFIAAFSTTLKRTLLFMLGGVVIIHVLNIIRIALLAMGFYYYPKYKELLHDILFPLFIYGVVFALWVLWVLKLSGNAGKNKA